MALSILPPTPDANDPRVPALVCFVAVGRSSTVAIFRKSSAAWVATDSNQESTRPPMFDASNWAILTEALGIETGYNWKQVKFRDLNEYTRRALFHAHNTNRAMRSCHPLAKKGDFMAHQAGRGFHDASDWKRHKKTLRGFSATIKSALHGYDDYSYSDQRGVVSSLVEDANNFVYSYRDAFVDTVNTVFGNNSLDEPLENCDCGHVEARDDVTNDHAGSSYCESCTDDLHEIDGEYYSGNDCYYWESDGEYHTESEPEDDEDEDEDEDDDNDSESCSQINSWRSSTGSLYHDRSFESSTGGDFIMGVELEVESKQGYVPDAAQHCLDHFNTAFPAATRKYITLKTDGSLSSYGFEIVTAARKLDDHLKAFGSWTPHSSLRAWNPGTCGVHVHIDSRAFSGLTLGKFLMFINDDKNEGLISAIAGRHPRSNENARSYCAALNQEVLDTPAKALKTSHKSRYRMVNLTNLGYEEMRRLGASIERDSKGDYSTVELRIFRASLKKERLLAQIEFTHASVMFCRTASYSDLTEAGFRRWLTKTRGVYKNLAKWFGVTSVRQDTRATAAPKRVPADADEAHT